MMVALDFRWLVPALKKYGPFFWYRFVRFLGCKSLFWWTKFSRMIGKQARHSLIFGHLRGPPECPNFPPTKFYGMEFDESIIQTEIKSSISYNIHIQDTAIWNKKYFIAKPIIFSSYAAIFNNDTSWREVWHLKYSNPSKRSKQKSAFLAILVRIIKSSWNKKRKTLFN